MKKKIKKKGFTLIELIAVIIIIGFLSAIAIPTVTKYIMQSEKTVYVSFEKTMIEAAKNRTVDCVSDNDTCELPLGEGSQKMSLQALINEGYLDNMKDPDTGEMCDANSYVSIDKKDDKGYDYTPCLYCGYYQSNNNICKNIEKDGDDPECGDIVGESTRWTNQNRTITVGCSDKTSGCEQSKFSKTFNNTVSKNENGESIGIITIIDRSGTTKDCNVKAYVDKTPPTCNIDVDGDFEQGRGWYVGSATALLKNESDADSGLLTYGIGTSIQNRNYNKAKNFEVGDGITTVFGYVKDIAGNEGLCTKEIRVGQTAPEFDLYYGYKILTAGNYTLSNITKSGSDYTTTSTAPKITINNLSKYIDVEKVIITLSNEITTETNAVIKSGSMTREASMQQGSKNVIFFVPKNTYDSMEITLGNLSGITYTINKIEAVTKNGNAWSNKNIELYIEPKDSGVRTSEVSYDNGETWESTFHKTFSTNESGIVITKNIIGMKSEPTSYATKIDKNVPSVTVVAKKKTANTNVISGAYTNEGLNYVFTKSNEGPSGSQIYYCKDTTDSCIPNLTIGSGSNLKTYNSDTTDYYIRYKISTPAGTEGEINTYTAKFDLVKPSCSFDSTSSVDITHEKVLKLTCTDTLSGLASKTITASDFTLSNNNMSIKSVSQSNVTDGIEISITLNGDSKGSSTIGFKANTLNDNASNYNDSVSKTITINGKFKVTLNNQSATTAGTGSIYEDYGVGWYSNSSLSTSISSITKPTKNGYTFGGYWTSKNGEGTQIINSSGNIKSGKESSFTSNTTLYAKWTECGKGYYCTGGEKIPCPAGTYGNGTTTGSTQAESCQDCGSGAWCTGINDRTTCSSVSQCATGATTATTQAEGCKACYEWLNSCTNYNWDCSNDCSRDACLWRCEYRFGVAPLDVKCGNRKKYNDTSDWPWNGYCWCKYKTGVVTKNRKCDTSNDTVLC